MNLVYCICPDKSAPVFTCDSEQKARAYIKHHYPAYTSEIGSTNGSIWFYNPDNCDDGITMQVQIVH